MNNAQRVALAVASWISAYFLFLWADRYTYADWGKALASAVAGLGVFILLGWQRRN